MPNAKDAAISSQTTILNLGDAGSGKTTLLGTYPGKVFAYLFDPNALRSLRGMDIEYETFYPDILNLDIKSLKRDKSSRAEDKISKAMFTNTYARWEADFYKRLDDGFFEGYQCIALDSATTFLDMIMDSVLHINGRDGQFPHQDDYPSQMTTFSNICRTMTSLGLDIYMTGHYELKEDDLKRMVNQPLMTGRLKIKIPILFSEIWHSEADLDIKGNIRYRVQTKPDRRSHIIRSSIKGLETFEDVTIDWNKPLKEQGLAKILKHEKDSEWLKKRQDENIVVIN
jgi:hypothetical protein